MSQTIPQESTSAASPSALPQQELETLLSSAGAAPLPALAWIEVTGPDRVRWLNGMVTNSVQDLATGAGCYNFILNAQGRIQGDAYIFAEPDRLRLQTTSSQLPNLLTLLDRFIIMDGVELTAPDPQPAGLLLAGPDAPRILAALDLLPPEHPPAPSLAHLPWRGLDLTVIRAYSPLVPRFEIWSPLHSAPHPLSAELLAHGAAPVTAPSLDLLRILQGTPLFGVDIRDRDLPQETAQTRALHFSKGCYLGQEIVERIRSRGSVHRTFAGFHLDGAPASPGLALTVAEKSVGELTSVALIPISASGSAPPAQIALGYIRREALAAAAPIHYIGGIATPATLPFDRAKIL